MPHLRARNLTLLTAFIGLFAGGFACSTNADDPVVLGSAGSAGTSAGSPSLGTPTWYQRILGNPADHTAVAAYSYPADSSRTFSWDIPVCYNSAGAAIAITRLSAN